MTTTRAGRLPAPCTPRFLRLLLLALATACGASPAGPEGPAAVATVELSSSAATLVRGESLALTAVPRAADGTPLPGRMVAWTSDAEDVAAVDPAGRVTAVGLGSARITVAVEGRSAQAVVGILPARTDDLAGEWRLRSFDGHQVPAAYAVFLHQPVGDRIVDWVEIRLDSAAMRLQGDGKYQRRYCFTELHDETPALRSCWGDHGLVALGSGAERGRLSLVSEYIQNLAAHGEVRADVTVTLSEPLWLGEDPRRTIWGRR